MTAVEGGSATPILGVPETRTPSLSIGVCSARHFDDFSWPSHKHIQKATVSGSFYLSVQQRHLQASAVAT